MRRKHLFLWIFFPDFLELKQEEVAPITVKVLLSTPKDPSSSLIVVGMLGTMELEEEVTEPDSSARQDHPKSASSKHYGNSRPRNLAAPYGLSC